MSSLEADAPELAGVSVLRTSGAGKNRALNLLLLIGSFGAGQGAIFAVQTALIGLGRVDLIASFGTCFSFAILCILLIDFGAQTTLARETAVARLAEQRVAIWAAYWRATPVRLVLGCAVIAVATLYALNTANAFERWYILCALPAALMWPFNATGILDGARMSGVAGVVGSAPYVISAVALALAINLDAAAAGALLGGALTVGYFASVVAQGAALIVSGNVPEFVRPTSAGIRKAAAEGASVFLATAPGQLYYRYQLLLAAVFLGPHGTAVFVYAKQIATAFAQLIAFVLRIEFPDLVQALSSVDARDTVRRALSAQKAGTLVGAAGTLLMLAGGAAVALAASGLVSDAALAAAIMSPTVVAGAVMAALAQALQARAHFHRVARIMIAATGAAALVLSCTAVLPHLVVFAVADLVVCAFASTAYVIELSRAGAPRSQSPRHG